MNFKISIFLVCVVGVLLIQGCKDCRVCELEVTNTDNIIIDTSRYSSAICGSKGDLKAYEEKCAIDAIAAGENSRDSNSFRCVCSQFE